MLPVDGRPISQKTPIEEIYEKRLPLYKKFCDVEVDNNSSSDVTVSSIIKFIDEKYSV